MYSSDLAFLTDVLDKARIPMSVVSPSDAIDGTMNKDVESAIGLFYRNGTTLGEYLGATNANTIYRITEPLGIKYVYIELSRIAQGRALLIGPYLEIQYNERKILEVAEKYGIDPVHHKLLHDYLISMTVVSEESQINLVVDTFCEHVLGKGGYTVEYLDRTSAGPHRSPKNSDIEDTESIIAGMKLMESRYAFENELIQMVTKGQVGKVDMMLSSFSSLHLENRVPDKLRNSKNYCIVTNTLLRKAAEGGGVHPVNIDRMSGDFAVRIEQCSSVNECIALMREMFKSYCRLVSKNSLHGLSPVVQKTMFLIDSELSCDLSLSRLAEASSVSPGYLSALFRRQVGKTVVEYVTEKRIAHAVYLLDSTNLQIQTIAAHCGIMDLQYFSKLFKKRVGKTPREYRESMKKVN